MFTGTIIIFSSITNYKSFFFVSLLLYRFILRVVNNYQIRVKKMSDTDKNVYNVYMKYTGTHIKFSKYREIQFNYRIVLLQDF